MAVRKTGGMTMSDPDTKSTGGEQAASSAPGSDAVQKDPWACYEDGAEFCGTESEAESCCCCCC